MIEQKKEDVVVLLNVGIRQIWWSDGKYGDERTHTSFLMPKVKPLNKLLKYVCCLFFSIRIETKLRRRQEKTNNFNQFTFNPILSGLGGTANRILHTYI